MTALLLLPAVLSTLLLAAHFLRAGQLVAVLLVLALIPLLPSRRPWMLRLVQLVLVLGALEWVRTLAAVARVRLALGEPWTRMALILGAVATFTLASALLLQLRHASVRPDAKPAAAEN